LKKEREKAEMKKLEILKENLTAAIETKKKHLQRPMDRKRLERK